MSEPSVPIAEQLRDWTVRLAELADSAPDEPVEARDQLAVENLIAAGIARLASEPEPVPSTEPSDRTVLAKDLLITADLVRRALQDHAT